MNLLHTKKKYCHYVCDLLILKKILKQQKASEYLAKRLQKFYLASSIDIQEIHGQCYDDVSNMLSKKKGFKWKDTSKEYKSNLHYCNSNVLTLSIT